MGSNVSSVLAAMGHWAKHHRVMSYVMIYQNAKMKYCSRITLCESSLWLVEVVFFFAGEKSETDLFQEKPSEARRCSQA